MTPPLSEADFQAQIIDLAHYCRWKCCHFRPARTAHGWQTPVAADGAGFPDLVLVRLSRVVFAELKSDQGKASAAQQEWLDALRLTEKVEVYLWRPADLEMIEGVLR